MLAVVLIGRISIGIESAYHFTGVPVDGPFQLFNALRRIAAGQRGGAHFQFFHGIGVPYLHYPAFRLLGGDLTASEISRQLTSIIGYPLVLVLFFRAFTRDWTRTLALSAIVYFVSLALPLPTITTPSVSMLGLRSALPTLIPAVMYIGTSQRARIVGVGAAIGFALLLGTEQGLAVTLAFVAMNGVAALRGPNRMDRVRETLGTCAVAATVLVVSLFLIGGAHGVAGALRYNFKLVPADQFWYFGAPASVFAPDWAAVFALIREMPRIPITLVAIVGSIALQTRRIWREPDGETGRRNLALGVLAAYGAISCASILGIFYDTYVEPCMRVLLLIGALELDRFALRRPTTHRARLGVNPTLALVCVGSFLAMILAFPSSIAAAAITFPHSIAEHVVAHRPAKPSSIWPETLDQGQFVMDQHRGRDGSPPVLWSTFSGWLEARNGIFNPTQFDYAMHALGPENRAAYLDQFRRVRPTLVQTVLPKYLMAEIWMEQTSWDFYTELLRNYRAIAGTPWSIFWERLPASKPIAADVWSGDVAPSTTRIELPVADQFHGDTSVILLGVQIDYRTHNALHALPFVGAIPRYFVSVDGAVSRFPVTLDPYTTAASFPVIVVRGRNPVLRFETYSLLPGARFDVSKVRVSRIPIDNDNIGWFLNLIEQERYRQPITEGSDTTGRFRWR
jgi:hypothetical protein